MNLSRLPGLTDSLSHGGAGICPRCQGSSRVGRDLCLSCLLSFAASDEEEVAEEEFDAALAAFNVPDTNWRLGNYEILEEIGRGGMGVIYRARQRHSRRIVALKRVLGYHSDSRETLARFRRETEAAASLDHPNILPIYEVGESEGMPYFSMKYASGGSLEHAGAALRDNPREVVALLAKVTRAVQLAHRQGILHRDLKPANILLDGRGEPMVSDFGLAKWLDATTNFTRSLTIFGTPGYIAPEQAEGDPAKVKPSADVYSLGAILFDLLTGRPPFLGEHALSVIRQAANHPAPKLRSLAPKADRDLETICAKCLERDAAARYASAGDLADDLERWLEGRSIKARPVLPPAKLWRWIKRNRLVASAAALVMLFAGIVFFTQVQRRHLANTIEQAAIYRRSAAVLPFLNLDTAANDNRFTASYADALGKKLPQSGAARVVQLREGDAAEPILPVRSVLGGLSQRAGTRTVLAGTVRRVGPNLSVSLRLLDAASGKVLLQKHTQLADSSSSPQAIARITAPLLSAALDGTEPADETLRDPALRNKVSAEYLRAADEFEGRRSKADLDHALDAIDRALAAEPGSALARARFVAIAVTRLSYAQSSPELLAKAQRYGAEAVRLNPDLAEVHRALSGLFYAEGDLVRSREEAAAALEIAGPQDGPILALAWTTRVLGRPDRALRWQRLAMQVEEHPADFEFTLADILTDLGRDEDARQIYERVSALHPDLPEGWVGLCRLRLLAGDSEGARKIYRANQESFAQFPFGLEMAAEVEFFSRNWPVAEEFYRKLSAIDPDGGAEFYGGVTYRSALGRLRQLAGAPEEAAAILQPALAKQTGRLQAAPQNPRFLYRVAALEASLGQVAAALTHLRAARDRGQLDYRSLRQDPRFDSVRGQPEFIEISDTMAARVAALRAKTVDRFAIGSAGAQEK